MVPQSCNGHMTATENLRIEALEKYRDHYAVEDQVLLQLCRIAAKVCDAPIVAVSWIGKDEQWFQCAHGTPLGRVPRALAPCDKVVRSKMAVETPDFTADPEWRDSPLFEKGLRAYFGFPMIDKAGVALGSFCILDTRARSLSDVQREVARELCQLVVARIEAATYVHGLVREVRHHEPLAQLGLVAGGLIHEIASPLTALIHRSSAARMSFEEGRQDVSEQLLRQEALAQRILKIVAAVRGFAERPEELPSERLCIADLIDQMLIAVHADQQKQKIAMYFDVPSDLHLRGNSVMCVQILVNLFNNAAQAMEATESKWIEISAAPSVEEGFVDLRFRDGGAGISEEVRSRLDHAFVSTKFGRGGLGLGLTICRRFAEQMSGSLTLDPDRARTTFILRLPKFSR